MFDPTSRIQSANLHGRELHHSARHRTHHAAEHSLRRRTATSPAPAPVPTPATEVIAASTPAHRSVPSLRSLAARYRIGRLAHRSA